MKADGLTGRDIAKFLGVSRATIYRYLLRESGVERPIPDRAPGNGREVSGVDRVPGAMHLEDTALDDDDCRVVILLDGAVGGGDADGVLVGDPQRRWLSVDIVDALGCCVWWWTPSQRGVGGLCFGNNGADFVGGCARA